MTGERSLLGHYIDRLPDAPSTRVSGRVREVTGLVIKAAIPHGAVGDLVEVVARDGIRLAEIMGFAGEDAVLMPLGDVQGIGLDSAVYPTQRRFEITVGPDLLGRVLNGLGEPIDGAGALVGEPWAVQRRAPHPLLRKRVTQRLSTGVRAIDGLLTIGVGQRIGLFAGSGLGKSTLLGQVARGADVDVVVVGLVGERGREVRDFLEDVLGPEGLRRSVVVCATSDEPALIRIKAAWVATAVAEWFRDRGQRVLLLLDSLTRFARAHREAGLAAGELPARRGYPPSTFSTLPRLLERAGNGEHGSITAIYTVLAGEDRDDPIVEEVRSVLDGHIVLKRALANRGHWPALDVLDSLSRLMNTIADEGHVRAATRFRSRLEAYESKRTLIELGAYVYGTDPRVDDSMDCIEELERFLRQRPDVLVDFDETLDQLARLSNE